MMTNTTEFNDKAFFKIAMPAAAIMAAIVLSPISLSVGLVSLSAIYAALFLPELLSSVKTSPSLSLRHI